ncbi:hypothetical protein MBLNU457_g0187t1 [Dothideomycetes sp. NU457]
MSPLTPPHDAVLPPGSLILITGITGYIGAHVGDQLLQYGYRVRGVVRDLDKAEPLTTHFHAIYGKSAYETYLCADQTIAGSLSAGLKDVSGLIHVASVVTLGGTYDAVVPQSLAFAANAIASAYACPSIKRFVFTSSAAAALHPVPPNEAIHITSATWNDDGVAIAQDPTIPASDPRKPLAVYAASKVLSERAVWDYAASHAKERPDIVVNTVLPECNIGQPVVHEGGWNTSLRSFVQEFHSAPGARSYPRHFVDVGDDARLHVAALLHPDVKGERVFAFAEAKNAERTVAVLSKAFPERRFELKGGMGEDLSVIEGKERAEELLKWLGRKGWVGMEESYRETGLALLEREAKSGQ